MPCPPKSNQAKTTYLINWIPKYLVSVVFMNSKMRQILEKTLWRAVSKRCSFSVDKRPNLCKNNKCAVLKTSGLLWMGCYFQLMILASHWIHLNTVSIRNYAIVRIVAFSTFLFLFCDLLFLLLWSNIRKVWIPEIFLKCYCIARKTAIRDGKTYNCGVFLLFILKVITNCCLIVVVVDMLYSPHI